MAILARTAPSRLLVVACLLGAPQLLTGASGDRAGYGFV